MLSGLLAAIGFSLAHAQSPPGQATRDQEARQQQQVFAETRRLESRRDQFLDIHGFEDRTTPTSRSSGYAPRLSEEVKPSFVSFTTMAAPKAARKAYDKAQKAVDQKEPDFKQAVLHLQEATALYTDYAAAWTLLGRVKHLTGDLPAAVDALKRAIEIDLQYIEPLAELADIAIRTGQWPQAVQLADHVIAVNPLFTLGHYYRGVALWKTSDLEEARKALLRAQSTSDAPLFPNTHFVLGEVYREQQEIPLAAREYRLYLAALPQGIWSANARQTLAEWRDLGLIDQNVTGWQR